jgi:hypothetical protein
MRSLVQEFNVYRWAGRMLLDAATMRRRSRFAGRAAQSTKHTRATDAVLPYEVTDAVPELRGTA